MNKICTSLEQSQKLIELGIDVNTADMDYIQFANDPKVYDCVINIYNNEHEDDWIPAWSLSALLALTPVLDIDGEPVFFWLTTGLETWYAEYVNVAMFDASNPIDAVYEMVCWLKENKKI